MSYLFYFFIPSERFKRLSFWEGLFAWVLLNLAMVLVETGLLSLSSNALLCNGLLWVHGISAIWTFAVICLKGWPDLTSLLRCFFSSAGRIKRLTFWEGLVVWSLLNIAFLMLEVAIFAAPVAEYLIQNLGDTNHFLYHFLFSTIFFFHWVLSVWVLVAICAKRWHDLNYPGWLAVVNVLPVMFIGLSLLSALSYLDLVKRDMIRLLITDSHINVLGVFSNAFKYYLAHYLTTSLLISVCITLGAFCFLGFFQGNPRANEYGKQSA